MARILCMHTGLTGILNASLELMNRLEQMGHEVSCASPQPVRKQVETYGFNFIPLAPINFDPAPKVPEFSGPLRKPKRLLHKYSRIKQRQAIALDNLGMKGFLEKVQTYQPDLVIVDIELHEHIMTLVSRSYQVLLLSQWFSTWDGKGLPPIQSDIIPGKGFKGSSLGLWLSWKGIIVKRWITFLKKKLISGYTDRRTILQKYAREVKFPLKFIRKNYWPGPFSYEGLPIISMTEEALEFPHKKTVDLTYVGPMVYAGRFDETLPQSLSEVFDLKQKQNKSLIYCSVSTYSVGDLTFLKKVIEAVRNQLDWLLVLSLGGKLDKSAFNDLPENVYLFSSVPQLQVLRNADLSINHGGIHTINECLYNKVPMLIYSGKRSDQNGCAARVNYHGVGVMADKDGDSHSQIRSKIHRLITSNDSLSIYNQMKKRSQYLQVLEHVLKQINVMENKHVN